MNDHTLNALLVREGRRYPTKDEIADIITWLRNKDNSDAETYGIIEEIFEDEHLKLQITSPGGKLHDCRLLDPNDMADIDAQEPGHFYFIGLDDMNFEENFDRYQLIDVLNDQPAT